MTLLQDMPCEACAAGAVALPPEQQAGLLGQIPAWERVLRDGVMQLERVYSFDDFAAAMAFTNRVAALAESVQHHPALLTEWGRVRVNWWTHSIRGLHRNDFILAARTEELYRRFGQPAGRSPA